MDIQGAGSSGTSGAALDIKALQLAKSQQEREGKATLQLLDAADVPKTSANGTLGSNVDTFV
jgi:hypothetical protein